MRVTVQRLPFLKSLEIAASIVGSKPQNEVLRYVKLTCDDAKNMQATDNELSIVCNVADAVQYVANHSPGRAGNHPNHGGHGR
jgi:DNA polymerase III sliding clamp (beta) subunit (PCNA family)